MKRLPTPDVILSWSPRQIGMIDHDGATIATAPDFSTLAIPQNAKSALVGIGRDRTFLKALRLPKVNQADLRQLIAIQWKSLFPVDENAAAYCAHQTLDANQQGTLTVVAAVRSADLDEIRAALTQRGIKEIRFVPMAVGAAAALKQIGKMEGLVIDEQGDVSTYDLVIAGDTIMSRTVLRKESLLLEARRSLLSDDHSDLPLFITPNAILDGATALLKDPLHALEVVDGYALISRSEEARVTKVADAKSIRVASLFMLCAISFGLVVALNRYDADTVISKGEATWNRTLAKLRKVRKDVETSSRVQSDRSSALAPAFKPGQRLADAMTTAVNLAPQNVWLTGLNADRGRPLQLRGSAMTTADVQNYVSRLGGTPRFREVQLVNVTSAKIEQNDIVSFSINVTAVANLPLPKINREKKLPAAQKGLN